MREFSHHKIHRDHSVIPGTVLRVDVKTDNESIAALRHAIPGLPRREKRNRCIGARILQWLRGTDRLPPRPSGRTGAVGPCPRIAHFAS
jgi:hypothetical protein